MVMGGNTSYGWIYSSPTQWQAFNPCNLNDPALGVSFANQVELSSGYGDVTSWLVTSAGTAGADYIEGYLGQSCLTDNGAGKQLTADACTPATPLRSGCSPDRGPGGGAQGVT
ncbi:hypothetical protein GXW82_31465 [Streptacidiphilus sp. 4-A2]|nr:hypothetical protein [Streptacidiphilus sp. 4-A2]